MKVKVQPRPQTIAQARAELSRRLEARREEIEAAVMTRVYSVSDTKDLDPTYAEGLKTAVTAAVDYGFTAIELGEERSPPPPPILLAQARLAARAGVNLDTVLRRYFAGHALLGDFLTEEAEPSGLEATALRGLLRTQAALFDRLLAAVSKEHGRESCEHPRSLSQQRQKQVERLLAGEMVDVTDLAYDFEGHHLAVAAQGPRAGGVVRKLASTLDCRLLAIRRDEEIVWAWLGGCRRVDLARLGDINFTGLPPQVSLAIGEPTCGLRGWRLTHQQALAALPIALRSPEPLIRYGDVALLASMLRDDLLVTSLRMIYLEPLERERDGGLVARSTLRAYFGAQRNVSSAAASLGVSRRTVAKRIGIIEERLNCQLASHLAEMEAILSLEGLGVLSPFGDPWEGNEKSRAAMAGPARDI